MTYQTRFLSTAIALSLGLFGCGDKGEGDGGDGGSTGNADTSADGGPTSASPTTNDSQTTMDSDSADSGSSGGTNPGTDTGGTTTGANPLPDGSMCTADDQCESEQCFQVPVLGGICGECNEDADCENGGCSIPNPLTMAPSVCNDGGLGGGCESDAVCQDGLTCALILSVDAIGLQASTCSECAEDGDCGNGQLCTPTYDVANISGHKFCVDAGMVANGEGCDFEGSGNDACTSGLCTPASAKGFVDLGICSECGTDGMGMTVDCPGMGTCMEAMVSLSEGLIPGTCM